MALAVLTLRAVAGTTVAADDAVDTYTWSAELVAFDETANTAIVKSYVSPTVGDLSSLTAGDRITVTWSSVPDDTTRVGRVGAEVAVEAAREDDTGNRRHRARLGGVTPHTAPARVLHRRGVPDDLAVGHL